MLGLGLAGVSAVLLKDPEDRPSLLPAASPAPPAMPSPPTSGAGSLRVSSGIADEDRGAGKVQENGVESQVKSTLLSHRHMKQRVDRHEARSR